MAVEAERHCGFRKVGGLYLCGEGFSIICDRLPYELKTCPTCGSGVKFSRGFQWLDWMEYAAIHEGVVEPGRKCMCHDVCPVCWPGNKPQPYGLLWVGEEFYTPANFVSEALNMGISRRIPAVPRNLKLGETWVLLAHIRACGERASEEPPFAMEPVHGVFYAFRPQRVELLIWESQAVPGYLEELEKKHITPVLIPNNDPDHDPKTPLKPKDDDRRRVILDNIKKMFVA